MVVAARAEGHEVAVLDNLSTGKRENVPGSVTLYQVDLRDADATRSAVAEFGPEVVSHQAAQASVSVSLRDPALDVSVNVLGAIHLLDSCSQHGVRRVVFASTGGAIYGEVAEGGEADEATLANPASPYAISKLTTEYLLRFYQRERGLDYAVLRYANVYGPRQDPYGEAGVVAIFMERALRNESLQINARRTAGDAGCVRDYTEVSDVARANVLALASDHPHSVMNVGTGHPTTTEELAQRVAAAVGQQAQLRYAPKRAGDLERSVLDSRRARAVLGSLVSLEDGLARTARWYEST